MEFKREEVTRRREALGLTKSAFSRLCGLHVATLSQIENGHLVPYPNQIKKITDAFETIESGSDVTLGIALAELRTFEKKYGSIAELAEVIEAIRRVA